jgi:hypothetical protein
MILKKLKMMENLILKMKKVKRLTVKSLSVDNWQLLFIPNKNVRSTDGRSLRAKNNWHLLILASPRLYPEATCMKVTKVLLPTPLKQLYQPLALDML